VKGGKIDIRKTQIHDYSLAWLGIDISVKSDGVKLIFMGTNISLKKELHTRCVLVFLNPTWCVIVRDI
jgi:hypothetical protein